MEALRVAAGVQSLPELKLKPGLRGDTTFVSSPLSDYWMWLQAKEHSCPLTFRLPSLEAPSAPDACGVLTGT